MSVVSPVRPDYRLSPRHASLAAPLSHRNPIAQKRDNEQRPWARQYIPPVDQTAVPTVSRADATPKRERMPFLRMT